MFFRFPSRFASVQDAKHFKRTILKKKVMKFIDIIYLDFGGIGPDGQTITKVEASPSGEAKYNGVIKTSDCKVMLEAESQNHGIMTARSAYFLVKYTINEDYFTYNVCFKCYYF